MNATKRDETIRGDMSFAVEQALARRASYDRADVLRAWLLLAFVDAVLHVGGFARLHHLVRRVRPIGAAPEDASKIAGSVCEAMNRARQYYFKRAWCLQSAAATACFLRARGVDARCVIGVRKIPFMAHAWVEVDGCIVMNEQENLRRLYTPIDTL